MEKIKIAVIGLGCMGKKYAKMLFNNEVKNMELAMVSSTSEKNQEWAYSTFGENFKVCKTEDELFLNAPDFDAVLIATPHRTHSGLTYKAMENGLAVFCEKPAGVTALQALDMNSNAFRCALPFAMMFHKRTMPIFIKFKEIMDNNELGSLDRIRMETTEYFRTSHYHHSSAWRSNWEGEGGGALINQGQHYLDLWQWLFGMPNSVKADIKFGKYNDFDVDDEATIKMKYANGCNGEFFISTGEQVGSWRIEVAGEKGKVIAEGNKLKLWKYNTPTEELIANSDKNSVSAGDYTYKEFTFKEPENPYVIMLENFADHMINGTHLIAKGIDGVNSISITNAAYLSAWINEEITFPMDNYYYDVMLRERANKNN
jgi:predicted dehydrogenase